MKRILTALAVVGLIAAAVAAVKFWRRPIAADVQNETLVVDGAARGFRLVVPHVLPRPAPLVFAFHGIGDSPESMAQYTGLDELAAENGFILAYPAARRSMWATVNVDREFVDTNPDVRFFDELLAHLSEKHDVDRNRVYVVGMSNGASFVQLLGMVRPHQIAATVAHSGPRPHLGAYDAPRPIMLIVGEDDPAFSALRSDAEQYRSNGYDAVFVSVPGLGHEWSASHTARIWDFLSHRGSHGQLFESR